MLRYGADEGRSVGKCAAAWQVSERCNAIVHRVADLCELRDYCDEEVPLRARSAYAGVVASIARNRGVGSTALTTAHFLLLYCGDAGRRRRAIPRCNR